MKLAPAGSAGSRLIVKWLAHPLTTHRQFHIVRRPPRWLCVENGSFT
jgi:hypothetical protein